MKILIIGNGFDLEHNLRTNYIDFLKFVKWIININGKLEKDIDKDEDYQNYYAEYKNVQSNSPEILDKLFGLIKDNRWINYFDRRISELKITWIDFESEISNILKLFEKARNEYLTHVSFYTKSIKVSGSIKDFFEVFMNNGSSFEIDGKAFDIHRDIMLKDLKRLTLALEIYLYYWVETKEIKVMNPDIAAIHPNKILTFNYTHTFDRIYGKSVYGMECCYIHGEIKESSTIDNCTLVLGVDDFVNNGEIDIENMLIGFKKYYQRLDKSTGTNYKKWIEEIKKDEKITHDVYFFGHSLDITDKEIIEPFIRLNNVKTTIYCYDKKTRSKLIANLVRIIDKSTIIDKIESGKIILELQSPHCDLENSELEIRSDCHQLYTITTCQFGEINNILNKIGKKILDHDVIYFNKIDYVVDMFDGLCKYNLLTDEYRKSLINIVQIMIEQTENPTLLDWEKWMDISVGNQLDIEKETDSFVSLVNRKITEKIKPKTDMISINTENSKELTKEMFAELYENGYRICKDKGEFDREVFRIVGNNILKNVQRVESAREGLQLFKLDSQKEENKSDIITRTIFSQKILLEIDEVDYFLATSIDNGE